MYSSTNYSASRDIPVQNIQPVEIFQCKIFSQSGIYSTKYSVSRNIPVQKIQQKYSSAKDSVRKDIPVQNIQS
jgi:hypothetical protein